MDSTLILTSRLPKIISWLVVFYETIQCSVAGEERADGGDDEDIDEVVTEAPKKKNDGRLPTIELRRFNGIRADYEEWKH